MPTLTGKTILLFSPQSWGKMMISKHHYAIELLKRGNKVYYVNPPINKNYFNILESTVHNGLYIIDSGLPQLRKIRFHSKSLFKIYNKFNLNRIKRNIKEEIDVIWSFDFFGFCDFSCFKKEFKIAHPVDFVQRSELENAKNAIVLFSVAEEIIQEFSFLNIPSYFINHSISDEFLSNIRFKESRSEATSFGYIGNLLRPDVDYKNIIKIVEENESVKFTFIGNFLNSNIGAVNSGHISQSINYLKTLKNVLFTGVLDQRKMAATISQMDGFLIAYDKENDFCRGTNYHKVIEYLATGKVIVSNHIKTYSKMNLFPMIGEDESSEKITKLFNLVVNNIDMYNSVKLQNSRIQFAASNTYAKQLSRIEEIIKKL